MNGYLQKAVRMIEGARPASGFRPQTEAEWQRVQAASVELGYAIYRDQGMDEKKARYLAELIHGGAAGRLLLEIALAEDGHEARSKMTSQVPLSAYPDEIFDGGGDDK